MIYSVHRANWLLGILFCVLFGLVAHGFAEDLEADFKTAKGNLTRDLSSPNLTVRAAAARKFADYPIPEAVKTLLQIVSATKQDEVRLTCLEILLGFREQEEVLKTLTAEILADLKRNSSRNDTCAGLIVLLASEHETAKEELQQVLTAAEKSPRGALFLVTVVDLLGGLKTNPYAVHSLQTLSESNLAAKFTGFRRAVTQALIRIQRPEAVAQLVEMYPASTGEARADIQRHLEHLSGLSAAKNPDWQAWWNKEKANFKFPAQGPVPRPQGAVSGPSYYGLPLYGARLVFILDTSGSMRGTRIEAAKRELSKAVAELPDEAQFNILSFNAVVIPWQKDLVYASPASRKSAQQFIAAAPLGSTTASYDALEAALRFDTDAVYFLTDGAPRGGKISNPAEIVRVISQINRVRRATIHTIGIQAGEGQFEGFLQALAAENFGVYRGVK